MKLYNLATDKIEDLTVVTINDVNVIVEKTTEQVLNEGGYYHISYISPPNRRYYTVTQTKSLVDNVYVVGYTSVEKPLADVIALMEKDLRETYYKTYLELPRINTGLGYDVWGSLESVEELRMWKDYAYTEIIDADDNTQTVDGTSYTAIADAIKTYRRLVYDRRKVKVSEVHTLVDVDACILYEATPYGCPELDLEGNPTGGTTTCYRNLVKDWEL